MSSFTVGRIAEAAAAGYLRRAGYQIIAQNWRTRYCEVDLVALKAETIYFIEVKYRRTAMQGDGFDSITPAKLRQMRFAAEVWVANNRWQNDYRLAVVAVSGSDFSQLRWLQL